MQFSKEWIKILLRQTGTLAIATLIGIASSQALAQSLNHHPSFPVLPPPPDPKCKDTPVADVQNLTKESLPIHNTIANYLEHFKSGAKFACESQNFRYEGVRSDKSISVISHYRQTNTPHAEIVLTDERNIGGFRKHGIVQILWPDGKPQAREYFCFGFPVGFHRYFDNNNSLRGVIDYSNSDYQLHKNHQGRHNFFDSSTKNSLGGEEARTLFSEIYALKDDSAKTKIRFLSSSTFYGWQERDPNSTIKQWTSAGDQGSVAFPRRKNGSWDFSERRQLINTPLDYTSFSEIYQRHKSNLPGLNPPERLNTDILECPWIDEAMSLAFEDERFALPPLKSISEAEREATPRARYASCLASPTVDCLLWLGLDRAKEEQQNHRNLSLRDAAVVGIATNQPRYAISAINDFLAFLINLGSRMPNPVFAPGMVLKAEAEANIGDQHAANKTLDEAYANLIAKPGYEIPVMLSAPTFARFGQFERVRKAYEIAQQKQRPRAYEILAELGFAYARAGRIDEAIGIARELRQEAASKHPLHLLESEHLRITPEALKDWDRLKKRVFSK